MPQSAHPLDEVQVTASKFTRETLKRLTIQFVKSHASVNPAIHQIGRWRSNVCPRVSGLQPVASAFVRHRVTEVARAVGAPTGAIDKACEVNVEIVFSPEPQPLLNHIAKAYPSLLGSNRLSGDITTQRAIRSWYVTGTRKVTEWSPIRLRR